MTRDAPRLDRTGDIPTEPDHDPRCDGHGWIDRDAEKPVPCLECKKHLRKIVHRRTAVRHTEDQ